MNIEPSIPHGNCLLFVLVLSRRPLMLICIPRPKVSLNIEIDCSLKENNMDYDTAVKILRPEPDPVFHNCYYLRDVFGYWSKSTNKISFDIALTVEQIEAVVCWVKYQNSH